MLAGVWTLQFMPHFLDTQTKWQRTHSVKKKKKQIWKATWCTSFVLNTEYTYYCSLCCLGLSLEFCTNSKNWCYVAWNSKRIICNSSWLASRLSSSSSCMMSRTLSSSFTPSPFTTSVRRRSTALLIFAGPEESSKDRRINQLTLLQSSNKI